MSSGEVPHAAMPERLDRRMRLGPFPSARDALKFVVYAAGGAVLVPFTSPYLWLGFLAVGFAVSVWRPDGVALDERALAFLRWEVRRGRPVGGMSRAPAGASLRHGYVRLEGGTYGAVVRAGGIALAYLPPTDQERRFDRYRELLRGAGGGFAWTSSRVPLQPRFVLPPARPSDEPEERGREGYRGLVEALCRRRGMRRVDWALTSRTTGPEGLGDLDRRVTTVVEGLAALGLRPARLAGHALRDAARTLGWPSEGAAP